MPLNPKQAINILDLLSKTKATSKIKGIADDRIDSALSKFENDMEKRLQAINKQLEMLQKFETNVSEIVSKAVLKQQNEIREIIRDEMSEVFWKLYVKRSVWK